MRKKIAIIGAGVGGLACACRLARQGHDVEVYEKLDKCGGRNHILEDSGFKFDMGPSFVLMPDLFEEIFEYCGQDMRDYLDLRVLDINYRIFYHDGQALNVYKDKDRTKLELEKIEEGASKAYDKFIAETERIYKLVRPLLYKCFSQWDLFNPSYWPLLGKMRVLESYWQLARKFFKTEKLCYAFTFEAMFMGVSPYQAPAFYSVISYADHVQKIAHPMGGMYMIPKALEKMALIFGTKFNYNCPVEDVRQKRGKIAVKTQREELLFDNVVINADYAYAQENILRRNLPDFKYSCSVYLLYLGLRQKLNGLEHHNLIFASDLSRNLNQIFEEGAIPLDPSFYVHVPTVTDSSLAPPGKDLAYILIPVANLKSSREGVRGYEDKLREVVFKRINEISGAHIEDLIEFEHRFYPQNFTNRYNIKYGATFGLAHNLTQSAFLRPANFDSKIKGLFYVGASTQPGGGLPVVIAGSRIVADLVK